VGVRCGCGCDPRAVARCGWIRQFVIQNDGENTRPREDRESRQAALFWLMKQRPSEGAGRAALGLFLATGEAAVEMSVKGERVELIP
jgi:hypothetical protein